MASRKCFQNELLLCDVTVLLNFGVSQRRLSVSRSWGRFWIKKNIISLGKWPRSSPAGQRALIIGLFFVVFCLITGLQRRSIVKLSRLSWSTRLKRGSQQTPYTARFCSKLSSDRSPSLEACNFPIVLSRRFHRPIYFYFEFISNSDPRNLRPRPQVFEYFWIRNSQLFLSLCGFRPHPSGEFESESGYF